MNRQSAEYVFSRHAKADHAAWALESYIEADITSEAERPTYRHQPRSKDDARPWAVIFLD